MLWCCLCRLVFAVGSHRDFALPFWHDLQGRDLEDRGYQLQDTGGGRWDLLLPSPQTLQENNGLKHVRHHTGRTCKTCRCKHYSSRSLALS